MWVRQVHGPSGAGLSITAGGAVPKVLPRDPFKVLHISNPKQFLFQPPAPRHPAVLYSRWLTATAHHGLCERSFLETYNSWPQRTVRQRAAQHLAGRTHRVVNSTEPSLPPANAEDAGARTQDPGLYPVLWQPPRWGRPISSRTGLFP